MPQVNEVSWCLNSYKIFFMIVMVLMIMNGSFNWCSVKLSKLSDLYFFNILV